MADNFSEMSIAFPVTEEQGRWLEAAWRSLDSIDGSGAPDIAPPEGLTLEDEDYVPCNLEIMAAVDEAGSKAWLYSEEGVDAETLARVLWQFLKHFDRNDGIGIEVALTCSKPRVGQFGGFAIWVTKDGVEAWSTSGWLAQKEKELGLVTCDNCSATSESGWGNTPLCVDCQLKTDPALVCVVHMLTHNRGELCPACQASATEPVEEFEPDEDDLEPAEEKS
jgi:hypothetical protein